MSSKLKIRIGDVEIDYEGPEQFLKEELPALLKTAMELHNASDRKSDDKTDEAASETPGDQNAVALTTGSIAARISAKSGGDLLLAAAGHLTLFAKKDAFTRQELLKVMQSASAYYRKSYSDNLSKYLNSAVKAGILSETATNTFALSASARADLEKKLANS